MVANNSVSESLKNSSKTSKILPKIVIEKVKGVSKVASELF